MKQNLGKLEIIDQETFSDSRGRLLLMNYKEHQAYVIPKDQERKLAIYQARYILAVLIGIFLSFNINWIVGCAVGLVIAGVLEVLYRKKFLPSLEVIESDDLPKEKSPAYLGMAARGKKTVIIGLVAAILLPLLLALYEVATIVVRKQPITEINNLLMIIVSLLLSVYSVTIAINGVKALAYLKKEGK